MSDITDRHEFGRRFKAAREARDLNQGLAAAMLGIEQPRISEIERGARVPSFPRAVWMIVTLGLDPRIIAPELFPPGENPEKSRQGH